MVHRPFRLTEIMQVLTKYKLEPSAARLSIHRQRTKHGSDRSPLKGEIPDYSGKTADRV